MNRQIVLSKRPDGFPLADCFQLVPTALPGLAPGSVLVRLLDLALDPYLRLKMHHRPPSYMQPFQLDHPCSGYALGQVIESSHPEYHPGALVSGILPWQDFSVSNGSGLCVIDPGGRPRSLYLGVLGMPGLSAYVGLLDVGRPQPGDTLFVSSAAGAVGSVVGQIGKIKGCRVIGSAGSDEKVRYLEQTLGFDAAFNYKRCGDLDATLQALCPDGIDIDFENVGGPLFEAVLRHMRPGGRVVLCGLIAQYNDAAPGRAPKNLALLYQRGIDLQAFIIGQHYHRASAFLAEAEAWLDQGRLRYREEIIDGLEHAPHAFERLFTGAAWGKLIVRVCPATEAPV